MKIWRCDLSGQTCDLMPELLKETEKVLASGRYTLGDRLAHFEEEFARYCNTRYALGVASGTEALYLAIRALEIQPGDEIITTPFTFIGTVSAILMAGAKPVFADIDPYTYNIDPGQIQSKISKKTKAIMPVHLYGLMADMNPIIETARRNDLPIIEDAAQAHGSMYHGKKAGNFGYLACYSFYPTKNLGAFGDAGAIVTDDEILFKKIQILRNYGQESLYKNIINGINSRLDELQAAYLSIKLKYLDEWNRKRIKLAETYNEHLSLEEITLPPGIKDYVQNYHVYTVRIKDRDALQQYLSQYEIQSNIYYPVPVHLQKANLYLGYKAGDFPHAERASREVLALPLYPELKKETVIQICDRIQSYYKRKI